MNNFAACAALLAVPAIVVSCSSSSGSSADASTDTREEPAMKTLAAMATLTDAANACSKDNLAPLEKAVKDLDADLARIQADTNALAPEQQAEFDKAFQALGKATNRLSRECGMKASDPLLKKMANTFVK